jgi:hypothetical protein
MMRCAVVVDCYESAILQTRLPWDQLGLERKEVAADGTNTGERPTKADRPGNYVNE